ncbi:unnamed protein product, partial [Didymodactylos carnosus]
MNVGGPLTITCLSTGWSQFPKCVSAVIPTTASIMATMPQWPGLNPATTPSSTVSTRCPYYPDIFNLTHGYILIPLVFVYPADSTAEGWVQFSCLPGYTIDPVDGKFQCINGVWSTKPRCLKSGSRCLLSQILAFIEDRTQTSGMRIVGTPQLVPLPTELGVVTNQSHVEFQCIDGYMSVGGPLNITCNADNNWSVFPRCQLISMTTTMPGAQPLCAWNPNMLFIQNGMVSNKDN